ncbi:putative N-acetylmannosamine-6-phosphate 2-epimerase [Photobacterium atrarenae]|uniref:Putative N-acetylmannosamine-6-phosphate 2-epimerase n=1 Tax=Photobacterium atrarenae TaxID=865757 RepID=A0ABY5GMN9_9GAMM|nr:N-acetylmannosamine-6-phosphate 2-epimerase [Photobacterium atrarenae]UTV30574.1 N-acetylmannosamine-6-phosphate 2-epimerase [Photobacterium atrarenae]
MNTKVNQLSELKRKLNGQTVVSIQPITGSPLERTDFIVAMAQAAEQAGTQALRIEGISNVTAVTAKVRIPVIGIVKRDLPDSPVRITPFLKDVFDLEQAGASIIAFDATDRPRPASREMIAGAIAETRCLAMADCSCFDDGLWAHQQGVEIIGSTLSGYVGGPEPTEPDFELIRQFAAQGFFTMAEGRFNTPELAAKAIECGAVAVTVGSALTRLEVVTHWFNQATQTAGARS